jgi:high affinity Mn2+ porin
VKKRFLFSDQDSCCQILGACLLMFRCMVGVTAARAQGASSAPSAGTSPQVVKASQSDPAKPSSLPNPQPPPAAEGSTAKPKDWNFHLQNTEVVQGDFGFPAKYSGPNSLNSKGEVQETVTLELMAGKRLGHGFEAYVDGLLWQGFGLSKTVGIEAFPNADAYKFGTEIPNFTFARLFIRKTIGFGGQQEDIPDGPLVLAKKEDISRLTITVGRFAVTDIVDNNTYASDPHTQFLNWAMAGNLAWDYAADAVGYAPGIAFDYNQRNWALRYGWSLLPSVQNGFTGDDELLMYPGRGSFGPIFKEWAMYSEYERRYSIKQHPGKIRFLAWLNEANMTSNQEATAILLANGPGASLSAAQAYRFKYGFGLNWEQEVAKNVGVFSRLGWNDGLEQAWAYTDASASASLGVSVNGDAWRRPGDTFGLANVVSGASPSNIAFLQAGGLGILAGDGALKYGPEDLIETYYNYQITKGLHIALDYQFVANPAFNQDRGPVSIFGARLHFAF